MAGRRRVVPDIGSALHETTGAGVAKYDSGVLYDSGATYDSPPEPTSKRKKMAKPKLNLSELTYEEMLTLATAIHTAMNANPLFPNPNPLMTVLAALITAAQAALDAAAAARDTLDAKMALRDEAFAALAVALSQLMAYVESVSAGDEAKILAAGMPVRLAPTKRGVPPEVENLSLTYGDFPGTLDAAHDAVKGIGTYEYQISPDPMSEASWAFKMTSTKSSATVAGLKSGDSVWIRVRAVGSAGPGPWSDPAKKVVP
jgi:hypothetical protein